MSAPAQADPPAPPPWLPLSEERFDRLLAWLFSPAPANVTQSPDQGSPASVRQNGR